MIKIVRKYRWNPTFDDIKQVMIMFDRRCDIQAEPEYVAAQMYSGQQVQYLKSNNTYITIQNDKDDFVFKLVYPDAVLISEMITDDYFN